jgi:hypothetical protein
VSSGSSRDPGPGSGKTPEQAWRETFNAFERAVGGPMEQFFQSDQFADAAAAFIKSNAGAPKPPAGGPEMLAPGMWAGAWGLASADDVRRLEEQLGEVHRRLDALEQRAKPKKQSGSGKADGGKR